MGHNYGASNPLSLADYQRITDAQRQAHDLLPELDKAEHCGVGCQQLREQLKGALETLDRLKTTYFPHGPPTS